MSVTIKNKMPTFERSAFDVLDDALKEGARDGLISAKEHAPFDKGGLRGNTDITRQGAHGWRISFWIEYARFQEFGGDSKRSVRNYTTGGTGAHYLKNAGDEQVAKLKTLFKKHGGRARA